MQVYRARKAVTSVGILRVDLSASGTKPLFTIPASFAELEIWRSSFG